MMASVVAEGEERLAVHRQEAAQAKLAIAKALGDLQLAHNNLLASKLDTAISTQRRVEEEALSFSKNVNSLYQRATKWKSEQKRFRASLAGLDKFEDWAASVESDLQSIATNLEYVSAVLERESADANGSDTAYPKAQ
ncbi:hypothetical protein Poli38472_003532 [Pythium oligandrum]|uniref:Biogenesis of lysosome-related organelles complex 1 subunit 1 n=1 Tax=Pythium oligandrum TaxID=41045 RepID=A0A8K1C6T2_PYTOL|nr:hypothetical protein Poli38472_003532 [Pythium oligandrum]|eukprot:TMW57607.1 hypothetical protein Poli38472_003532 [Pythium oligandrum]